MRLYFNNARQKPMQSSASESPKSCRQVRFLHLSLALGASIAVCALLPTAQAQVPAPTPNRVYVSSEKDNRIQVFDTQG